MKNKVESIMSRNIYQIKREETVSRARKLMSIHRIKSVFVLEEGKPVGMIPMESVLDGVEEEVKIEAVMMKNFQKIPSNSTIQNGAKLLMDSTLPALPVVDDKGIMVGVLRESDIVKDMVSESELPKLTAERVAIYLAMTEDREHEKYWLDRAQDHNFLAAITQVGENAERLAIKLREATIVASIAKGVISEDINEKLAVSNAVRDVYAQINLINPGLGGGFKIVSLRSDKRIIVAAFGRCGHALANGPQTIASGFSII